jgi:ankyrin repeat protein
MSYLLIKNVKLLLAKQHEFTEFRETAIGMSANEKKIIQEETTKKKREISEKKNEIVEHINNLDFDPTEVDNGSTPLIFLINLNSRSSYIFSYAMVNAISNEHNIYSQPSEKLKPYLDLFGKSDISGRTPLHYAMQKKLYDICSALIYSRQANEGGNATFMYPFIHKWIAVTPLMFGLYLINEFYLTSENTISIEAMKDILIKLFKSGRSNFGYASPNGNNAFILACRFGIYDLVKLFLNSNEITPEIVNKKGEEGKTALMWICIQNDTLLFRLFFDSLIRREIDIHIETKDETGRTSIDFVEEARMDNKGDKMNTYIYNYFKAYKKVRESPLLIKRDEKGTDVVDEDNNELTVQQYLDADPGHICFYINSQIYYSSYDILKSQIEESEEPTQIKLECYKDNNDVTHPNLNLKYKFFNMGAITPLPVLIFVFDVQFILETENDTNHNRCFAFIQSGEVNSVLSQNFYNIYSSGARSVPTGSDHCNVGNKKNIYIMMNAELVDREELPTKKSRKGGRKTIRLKAKRKKTNRKYKPRSTQKRKFLRSN